MLNYKKIFSTSSTFEHFQFPTDNFRKDKDWVETEESIKERNHEIYKE